MDARLQNLMLAIDAWREDVPGACDELDLLADRVRFVTGKSEPDSTLPPGLRILGLYILVDEAMDKE